ncbi:MAG TPA: peptidase S9 family protein, partial [Erythrobacter sp.]|nr:peptidase S9 family protein [Erythrobacter sp.]
MAIGKLATGIALLAIPMGSVLAQQAEPAPQDAPARSVENQRAAPMTGAAMGSDRTGPERRFTGADLFDIAIAADPQISPDGRHIAYVRRTNDIM